MNNPKILIANNTPEQGITWANELKNIGAFTITRKRNGEAILSEISVMPPDMLVLESKMQDMSIEDFLNKLSVVCKPKPLVLVLGNFEGPELEKEIRNYEITRYIARPFSSDELIKIIVETLHTNGLLARVEQTSPPVPEDDLECVVTDVIHRIGIPAHIKGYHYLRYAILLSVSNNNMAASITKVLYPAVADNFKTTPSRVERAIRHAIELAWDRGDIDTLNSIFGYTIRNTKGKPTNSEFIALIADKLRLGIKIKSFDNIF